PTDLELIAVPELLPAHRLSVDENSVTTEQIDHPGAGGWGDNARVDFRYALRMGAEPYVATGTGSNQAHGGRQGHRPVIARAGMAVEGLEFHSRQIEVVTEQSPGRRQRVRIGGEAIDQKGPDRELISGIQPSRRPFPRFGRGSRHVSQIDVGP